MIREVPKNLAKDIYSKEMDSFETPGLVNFIEELWRIFAELLDICYNKRTIKPWSYIYIHKLYKFLM